MRDTNPYLAWFVKGISAEEILRPWVLLDTDNDQSIRIVVTGFGPACRSEQFLPNCKGLIEGTLPVTSHTVRIARHLMDTALLHSDNGNDSNNKSVLRVVFVHWGGNYQEVSSEMEDQAKLLAEEGGYNLILGSDGSHTVQPMELFGLQLI